MNKFIRLSQILSVICAVGTFSIIFTFWTMNDIILYRFIIGTFYFGMLAIHLELRKGVHNNRHKLLLVRDSASVCILLFGIFIMTFFTGS